MSIELWIKFIHVTFDKAEKGTLKNWLSSCSQYKIKKIAELHIGVTTLKTIYY